MRSSRHIRFALGALGLIATASCDALLVEPVDPAPEVVLSLLPATASQDGTYGDLIPGLAPVRQVWFRFTHDGVSRDTTIRALRQDNELHTRMVLRPDEARGWLEVRAELRMEGGEPLFSGHGLVNGRAVVPTARIEIVPVAHVIGGSSITPFNALGVTKSPVAVAMFASGFPIEGAQIEWISNEPSIVEVVGDGLVSRSNGSTFVTASSHGAERTYVVQVRQVPVILTGMAPADTTVAPGASFQARAFGQDANGFPLLPGAGVSWTASGAVSVDARGVVTAGSVGTGTITVTFNATSHETQVDVVP